MRIHFLRRIACRRFSTAVEQIPTKHSRNQLPQICSDQEELSALTSEIMEAPLGSLFSYDTEKEVVREDIQAHRLEAWSKADPVVQKVEYLLRGYSAGVEGTIWNRCMDEKPTKNVDIQAMIDLEERLWREGEMYMTLRIERMDELFGTKAAEKEEEDAGGDSMDQADEIGASNDSDDAKLIYGNDFAFPGPTIAMYEAILDSLACEGGSIEASWEAFQKVILRHGVDGDDDYNTNEHTRPSVLVYNALIRNAANQTYEPSSENMKLRDEAICLAFQSLDALNQSKLFNANSATYSYLLKVVSKYFPPSQMRGNIAHGMWHHACNEGIIDDDVIKSHLLANTPSNGEDFDKYIETNLEGKLAKDLSPKWYKNSRKLRHSPEEPVY